MYIIGCLIGQKFHKLTKKSLDSKNKHILKEDSYKNQLLLKVQTVKLEINVEAQIFIKVKNKQTNIVSKIPSLEIFDLEGLGFWDVFKIDNFIFDLVEHQK